MVENAAAAEAPRRRAFQEILEVRQAAAARKEELSVKHLRKQLVEIDQRHFAAKPEHVRAAYPRNRVDEIVVVLDLRLIGLRCRAELKTGAIESELINALRQVICRPVDDQAACWIIYCDRVLVDRAVVDMDQSEAEF